MVDPAGVGHADFDFAVSLYVLSPPSPALYVSFYVPSLYVFFYVFKCVLSRVEATTITAARMSLPCALDFPVYLYVLPPPPPPPSLYVSLCVCDFEAAAYIEEEGV